MFTLREAWDMEQRAIVVKTMGSQEMSGAIVIKAMGNPRMAGAIIDAIKPNVIPLNNRELKAVKAELARQRARQGVKKPREDEEWQATKLDLRRKYGTKHHSDFYVSMLIAWTISSLFICECCKRLYMFVREGLR